MNLFVLLQDNVTNVRVSPNDIAWRTTDVIYVCAGLISVVSAYFIMKNAQDKINDKIESQKDANKARIDSLEARVTETENSLDNIEKNIDEKIDKIYELIRTLTASLNAMETKILERLLDKK